MARLYEFSPITGIVRDVFDYAKWLSLQRWLSFRCRIFRPRSMLTHEEVNCKEFTARRARAIEFYMMGWVGLELGLVIFSCLLPLPFHVSLVFAVICFLRILEIVQVTVNVTLFDPLSGRPDERVASRARMLTLAGVNFIELLLCFGVIYSSDYQRLAHAGRPLTAFYFSVITQLTIGYGDVYPTGWLRVVAATQGLVGLLFVLLIFGRFIASLSPIKGILDDDDKKGACKN
jgi:hypothetical protein